jgi:hypothetical protein
VTRFLTAAFGATTMFLELVGRALGGWMASGEPMYMDRLSPPQRGRLRTDAARGVKNRGRHMLYVLLWLLGFLLGLIPLLALFAIGTGDA